MVDLAFDAFYLIYICWTIVGVRTFDACLSVFTYAGQLWGTEHLMGFYLFEIYWTFDGDRIFDEFLSVLDILDNC